jgi:hypothetical protein
MAWCLVKQGDNFTFTLLTKPGYIASDDRMILNYDFRGSGKKLSGGIILCVIYVRILLQHNICYIEVKVELSLCFNWTPCHVGVLGEWRYSSTHSWPQKPYAPATLPPRERAPGTHWIGGWVGPRVGLDTMVERKIPSLCQDSNHQSSSLWPSAVPLSYPGSCYIEVKIP